MERQICPKKLDSTFILIQMYVCVCIHRLPTVSNLSTKWATHLLLLWLWLSEICNFQVRLYPMHEREICIKFHTYSKITWTNVIIDHGDLFSQSYCFQIALENNISSIFHMKQYDVISQPCPNFNCGIVRPCLIL